MKNRKTIIISIALVVLAIVIFGVWKWTSPKKINPQQSTPIQYKEVSIETKKEISNWQKYENDVYKYQISYPNDWHIFTDEAKADFTDVTLGDNEIARQGGTVFFSNKDNINYTEESKPDDFHLLGLLIYEKPDTDLNQYANLLGFNDETGTQSIPFEADNLVGKEFFSIGAMENEPRSAVIFKNENRFFVFHLGFIGDDAQTLKTMEEIVGSFHIGE